MRSNCLPEAVFDTQEIYSSIIRHYHTITMVLFVSRFIEEYVYYFLTGYLSPIRNLLLLLFSVWPLYLGSYLVWYSSPPPLFIIIFVFYISYPPSPFYIWEVCMLVFLFCSSPIGPFFVW